MLSKAEVMQCSHSKLLITHLEQLNLILRVLIEKLSGSTGANFKDKQARA